MDLSGVYPALTTPFAADGSVSIAGIKHNIERYNSTALTGYVAMGSTGESVLLVADEMGERAGGGEGSGGPGNAADRGHGCRIHRGNDRADQARRRAWLSGCSGKDAALLQAGLQTRRVDRALPPRGGCVADSSAAVFGAGVYGRDAGGAGNRGSGAASEHRRNQRQLGPRAARSAKPLLQCPADFQILVGSAPTVLASLTVGARGAILALASALPEMCVALYDLVRQRQLEKARELQNALLKASAAITSEAGIAGIKFVMDQRGYRGGIPRLPLVPPSEAVEAPHAGDAWRRSSQPPPGCSTLPRRLPFAADRRPRQGRCDAR